MKNGETFSFNRFERQWGHKMKTSALLVLTVDNETPDAPSDASAFEIEQSLEDLIAKDTSILGLLGTLLSVKTLPHILALVAMSVLLYAVASGQPGTAAIGFSALAVGYAVTALLSNVERIRSWTKLSEWGEERPPLIKRIAFSFRILILPYGLAVVFGIAFLAMTTENARDALAVGMGALFVVWAIAQGRSFAAWAAAQSAKKLPESKPQGGNGYAGIVILGIIVLAFGSLLVSVFSSIHDPANWVLGETTDLAVFGGLSIGVFAMMNAFTWKIRKQAIKDRSLRRFHFKWSACVHIFVTWHLLTVYRHAAMEIGDLEIYVEELSLMIFTVFMGIWSLTSRGIGSELKLLNNENALPWGLAFGYAYAGSVAMISSTLGDLRLVMMLGHIIAALTGVWMHRAILNSVLGKHEDDQEIQTMVESVEATNTQTESTEDLDSEPVVEKDDWNEHLDSDWEKPKDIGIQAEVEWEDVINIDD
jgi:hypothetical protein